MSYIAWNCRGLGNPCTVQELFRLVREQDPLVLFVVETGLDEARLEVLRCKLHFSSKLVVSRREQGGGLTLFWKQEANVTIKSYSLHHIDTVINEGMDDAWRFTGFYGAPETHRRHLSWALLQSLHQRFSLPWLCMGDFNELLSMDEKQGGPVRSSRQMQDFRDAIDVCGFMDLGYQGPPFTWCNNRVGSGTVWERLDRGLATIPWFNNFPEARIFHLHATNSDHYPICLVTKPAYTPPRAKPRPFRFEEVWLSNPGCRETVMAAWATQKNGSHMFRVQDKIRNCRMELRKWSRCKFGNISQQLKIKTAHLRAAEENSMRGMSHSTAFELKKEVHYLLSQEERMWSQRARTGWLKGGDRNTRFFHQSASQRRRRNLITELHDNQGVTHTGDEAIGRLFEEYFDSLFKTSNPVDFNSVLEGISPVVTVDMNTRLSQPFQRQEVDHAIKQMGPLKAPGPDGMSPIFYQTFWDSVGNDVSSAILSCLNSGNILKSINHTYITLIPKKQNPTKVTDFRPISLCNVIYKILSKVLTNRLKSILPHIISETQSAFVPGRLITDNILVAFETLHHMKTRSTGKDGFMALKLDMSKAYDRVEWVFLKHVMLKMGFNTKWVSLMMECISSVSYSILINGSPQGLLKPTRGLRQGDPLSPYLFLLCAEGLHGLIHQAANNGLIRGISLSRGGPQLTHLFFADDSLLFCRARREECEALLHILFQYEVVSGQQINRDKTTLFFSKSTPGPKQSEILQILGVPVVQEYEKYLGLPSFVGRSRRESFTQIKEKIWQRLQGWKQKILSQAGREILIKAVVQAIPAFSMSCFKLPMSLCQDIEVLIRKFWWGNGGSQRKIHWVNWDTLCTSKRQGGMGFRDMRKFNDALLAKQVWRLQHNDNSLFYKVFKAKYFPHCSILDEGVKTQGSYAWKSITQARKVIREGAVWRISSGQTTKIWGDRWVPGVTSCRISSDRHYFPENAKVANLIDPTLGTWKKAVIEHIFSPIEAQQILGLPLGSPASKDTLYWPFTPSGKFSVRSAYHMLMNSDQHPPPLAHPNRTDCGVWQDIWSLNTPPKIRHFLWRAYRESLPTKKNLKFRHIPVDPGCPECPHAEEDALHSLWGCQVVVPLWAKVGPFRDLQALPFSSFGDLLYHVLTKLDEHHQLLFAVQAWLVWFHRNKGRVEHKWDDIDSLGSRAAIIIQDHLTHHSKTESTTLPTPTTHWKPPDRGTWKLNFDGAMRKDIGAAGVGVVVRDHQGQAIAAFTKRFHLPQTPAMIEALAAREAIQLALELKLDRVSLEGDSATIIKELCCPESHFTPHGHIIEEIQDQSKSFHSCSFQHTRRQANTVAHVLAQKSFFFDSHFLWLTAMPHDVISFLQSDLVH
jgi:hypothetical protein